MAKYLFTTKFLLVNYMKTFFDKNLLYSDDSKYKIIIISENIM